MDINSTLIHWGIPCLWPLLCFFGLSSALRIAKNRIIYRRLPKEGFPSDDGGAARVRFWKSEPLRMRETLKVKAFVFWIPTFLIGGAIIAYVIFVVL